MIVLLRRIADWLDRKFPDKVWVRRPDYDDLVKRVNSTESEIARLKTALGMMGHSVGGAPLNPYER